MHFVWPSMSVSVCEILFFLDRNTAWKVTCQRTLRGPQMRAEDPQTRAGDPQMIRDPQTRAEDPQMIEDPQMKAGDPQMIEDPQLYSELSIRFQNIATTKGSGSRTQIRFHTF